MTPTDHREHYIASSEWVGRLSACIAMTHGQIERNPKGAARELRACLSEFLVSPVPSEELRKTLREYLR